MLPVALVSLLLLISWLLMTPNNALTEALNSTLEPALDVVRSLPEGEPLLDSMTSCQNVTGPKSLPEQLRWDVLSIALSILQVSSQALVLSSSTLQELSVPYLLESGSLLHLVRECGLG